MHKPKQSKIPRVIWPAMNSQFKCRDSYKNFIQNREYKITAFGTEARGGEKKKTESIPQFEISPGADPSVSAEMGGNGFEEIYS